MRPTTRKTAAAAGLALALALTGCGSDAAEDPSTPTSTAAEPTSEPAADQSSPAATTALTVSGSAAAGRCMVPNAEALGALPTAFEGTVTSLEDGVATLDVVRWYAGEESQQVTVAAPDEDMRALLVAVEFEVGETYLVSATDHQVSLCGFTAEKTPELEAMYADAFAS